MRIIMMYGGHFGFGWVGMLFGLVIFLALLVGLVFLVVWAVKRGSRPGPYYAPPAGGQLTAKEILQARYAKGEITREQYKEMLVEVDH